MSKFSGSLIKILLALVVVVAVLATTATARLPTRADVWMISPRARTLFHQKSLVGQQQHQKRLSRFGAQTVQRILVKRQFLPQDGTSAAAAALSSRPTTAACVNSFLRRHQQHRSLPRSYQRILVKRHLLDFFDPLEPIETVWELYVNRYEILDEMVSRLSQFTRRRSLRAGLYFVGALGAAEILARVGVLGKKKKSLVHVLRDSRRVNEGVEERLYQKTSSWMLNHAIDVFSKFHHFSNKSKFAIAVSAGGLFGQVAIQATVLAVKTVLISFFVLETASFLGIIGDPGESLLDFFEDEYERHAAWTTRVAHWHKGARQCMNLEVLEELYEACVDEEKIASFGFSVGTIFALVT